MAKMDLADLASRQLTALGEITRRFDDERIGFWLSGGWAVDFRLGRVTRPHSDVDLVVATADADRVSVVMAELGFQPRPSPMPQAIALFDRNDVRVEVTFIEEGPGGETVTPGYEHWPWDEGSFPDDLVTLAAITLRAVSAAGLLAMKRDWQGYLGDPPRPHDVADIAALEALDRR